MNKILYFKNTIKKINEYSSATERPTYKVVVTLLTTFLVVFPKSGFKLGNIPITTGYILLALSSIPLGLVVLKKINYLNKKRILAIFLMIPFQFISTLSLLFKERNNLGMSISLVISFIFIPWVFIVIFGFFIDKMNLEFLFNLLKFSVLVVASYGIFLFFFKIFAGYFFEIPFLTVNLGDAGGAVAEKHNNRGELFKLISTYNNGNLYGVCILMFLPIYSFIERNKLKVGIIKFSLILSLSRSVWFGLIIFEAVSRFIEIKISHNKNTYLKFLITTLLTVASMLILILSVLIAVNFLGFGSGLNALGFLFDQQLGGRSETFETLNSLSFFPTVQTFQSISEIVYISILENFGIIGLITFLLFMFSPLIISKLYEKKSVKKITSSEHKKYKKYLNFGLIIYLLISLSDGGILNIPVMAIYWFLASLYLSFNLYIPSKIKP